MTHARLIAVTIVACLLAGCTTTTNRMKPSARVLERHGVDPGDTILLRYANVTDPSSSSRSETIRVHAIGEDGIVGVNASGQIVVAKYDELLQVEKKSSEFSGVPDVTELPGARTGGRILKGITNVALLWACMRVAAYSCPQVGD